MVVELISSVADSDPLSDLVSVDPEGAPSSIPRSPIPRSPVLRFPDSDSVGFTSFPVKPSAFTGVASLLSS